jgi:hypothetical protein
MREYMKSEKYFSIINVTIGNNNVNIKLISQNDVFGVIVLPYFLFRIIYFCFVPRPSSL